MADRAAPAVFSVPAHRPFADALAEGLIARTGSDRLALARGLVLVPNNRAARAITDAFVRRAEGGLLLPRLVAIGDPDLDETLGQALDPADSAEPLPPAIDPMVRRMMLARIVAEERALAGEPVDAAEAVRLAQALARTLDQMIVEGVPIQALGDLAVAEELSDHWQRALGVMAAVLRRWPAVLRDEKRIDLADRRNRLLDRAAAAWRARPPQGFVVAAGISDTAPAVAGLLRRITRLGEGMVLLPGLDLAMDEAEWDALGPDEEGRGIETHPQYSLKLLLDRMGVARGEVARWRWGGGPDAPAAPAARGRAVANAMAPARFTGKWQALPPAERRLGGVRAIECATPAEEAQAIAIAIRQAIDEPGRTAALITPDRALARRVSAHLARWGIAADDSAGRPLSATPPGTLVTAIAEAAASGFAPVELLTLLKHPLVQAGEVRADWLASVRALDLKLRGPRPAPGLAGIAALRPGDAWWARVAETLAPLEAGFSGSIALPVVLATIREAGSALSGDAIWAGPTGRAAADLFAALELAAPRGPAELAAHAVAPLLSGLMHEVAVRPPQGGHPRVSIWGLIEQRLQHADLVVAGGLNEGVWPALPSPDPWLSPRVRRVLKLPGLERRIGLAAHDFVGALGSPRVLVTRARRDARAPTIASRFWLRLEAMTGGIARAPDLRRWAAAIDRPADFVPAERPRPAPSADKRPRKLAVTRLDRLKADPYAFYAQEMLRLSALDPVDAEPSPAWRGSAVHAVLEAWAKEDDCDPSRLAARAETMLDGIAAHPVLRALWTPRLREAIGWIADEMLAALASGRKPLVAEIFGEAVLDGIRLYGKVDRIDRLADGGLAIVDYKTGQPPGPKQVAAGYAMQLGLLGLIAEQKGFEGIAGKAAAFEYWSLAQKDGQLGHVAPATGKRAGIDPADFTALAHRNFTEAAARWLTGDAPFVAKLHPELAPYGDYDQLMRLDEWYGRQERAPEDEPL